MKTHERAASSCKNDRLYSLTSATCAVPLFAVRRAISRLWLVWAPRLLFSTKRQHIQHREAMSTDRHMLGAASMRSVADGSV